MLWIFLTVAAAAVQTARNALQRGLTDQVGALGATHARFLYGLPFALGFVALLWLAGRPPPVPTSACLGWGTLGAFAQIGATACLLAAMHSGGFLVSVAYTKTEPALVLLAAWGLVGETPTPVQNAAILGATAGVVLMAWPARARHGEAWGRPLVLGLVSGALFALSAVCFRQAILGLGHHDVMVAATTMLALVLVLQTLALSGWLALTAPATLGALLARPRAALPAGLCGALASALWFLAFALAAAPLVRTLGLVEVVFSHVVGRRFLAETVSMREGAGVTLLTVGIAGLFLGG